MIRLYRITSTRYANDLSGKGARLNGGRWNSMGNAMLYTSDSLSTAMLEVLIHIDADLAPSDLSLVIYKLPKDVSILTYGLEDLNPRWHGIPPDGYSQALGDKFIADNDHLLLRIPSAVAPTDTNVLINPNHRDAQKIIIGAVHPFTFDARFFKAPGL